MSCSPFDIRDYFFGELSRDDQHSVDLHVKSCAACREELDALRLMQSALLTLRDEEPPRRIAFVSDKIFEPAWWQRLWHSGPKLGFVSAAMLSAAILVHAFVSPPAPVAPQIPGAVTARSFSGADVARIVDVAVTKAVADSEGRQEAKFQQALATKQRDWDLQHRASLVAMREYVDVLQKQMNVMLVTSNRTLSDPR